MRILNLTLNLSNCWSITLASAQLFKVVTQDFVPRHSHWNCWWRGFVHSRNSYSLLVVSCCELASIKEHMLKWFTTQQFNSGPLFKIGPQYYICSCWGGGVSMVSLPTYHSCCTSLKTGGQKYISKSEVAGKVNFPHSDKLKIISEVVFVVHEFQM